MITPFHWKITGQLQTYLDSKNRLWVRYRSGVTFMTEIRISQANTDFTVNSDDESKIITRNSATENNQVILLYKDPTVWVC